IINRLMEEYSLFSLEQKKLSSDQTLVFIEDRLVDICHKLDSVQQMYLDYQGKYNIIDAETQSSKYFEIIGESDKSINEQTLKLNVAEMVDSYLADKKNEFTRIVVPSTLGLEDPTLNELVGGYNKAQLERKQLLDGNVPVGNPAVKEIDGQIEKMRVSIRENLRNIKLATNSVVNRSRQLSGQGETQLKAMPEKVKELAEIKRQLETYLGLYKLFTEKKEETAISRASTVPNSSIIDKAYPPGSPIKPKRKTIQVMAVLLGLAIPALFIFAAEILNDKVSTRYDVEKLTEAPILGEIGHSYSDTTLVVSKTTRSMVAEQFRIIRSNLQYILHNKEKSVILATSTFSGEGKSYISTNMGAVLALAGKKTIVLEFDIRKPKVLSGLGIARGPGITNYLVGKANLPDLVKPVPEHENLFVMGCGPIPPNPAELLLDSKMDDLFKWLRENFDMVIIDTAPVGMVSDAMTLGKYADASLYLVRQGHTFKKQVALIDEFYKEKKLPRVSIIINDVKLKTGYGYYGYGRYGYGYGYGYGSYYEEEAAPANIFEKILGWFDVRRLFGMKKRRRKG
ncbi:MAG: polysaccharide biosynthesis tyrosine autokinase, partial [Chitinophagaceae bacterium]